jgi:hypothetical protein
LDTVYHIDESDWMVLSDEGWRAVAEGDVAIWNALERKLLVGFYVSHPQLIAVIGHPSISGEEELRRIVCRIRSLPLPAPVLGFLTDESGWLLEILDPLECSRSQSDSISERNANLPRSCRAGAH